MSFSAQREKFYISNQRKKPRRSFRESRGGGGNIKNERDDFKRFSYLLQKYCEGRLCKSFPLIHFYMIKDDGELICIDHLLGLKKIKTKLDALTISAYENMEMELKNMVCTSVKIINLKIFSALCQTLPHVSNLTSLTLEYCHLTADHIQILQEYLNKKKTITELSLSGNPMEQQAFHKLIGCGLKVLVLKFCRINEKGLRKFAKEFLILPTPLKTLIHLDLSHNMIFCEGCKYVASILRCDRTLRSINLTDCKIGDGGFQELMMSFGKSSLDEGEITFRRKIRFEYFNVLHKFENGDLSSIERLRTLVNQAIPDDAVTLIEQIRDDHPIVIESYQEDGEIFCCGNYSLETLNFAYNHLTKSSLDFLLKTLMEQSLNFGTERGIKRVVLEGNASNDQQYVTLKDMIQELLDNKKRRYRTSISDTGTLHSRKSIKSSISLRSNVNSTKEGGSSVVNSNIA